MSKKKYICPLCANDLIDKSGERIVKDLYCSKKHSGCGKSFASEEAIPAERRIEYRAELIQNKIPEIVITEGEKLIEEMLDVFESYDKLLNRKDEILSKLISKEPFLFKIQKSRNKFAIIRAGNDDYRKQNEELVPTAENFLKVMKDIKREFGINIGNLDEYFLNLKSIHIKKQSHT